MSSINVGNDFGQSLKELRLQSGLTQREIASELGVSQGTYYRLEIGQVTKIEENILRKLSEIFNVPTKVLLNYGEHKKYLSLSHLKAEVLEFVLDPTKTPFLETAYIEWQIKNLTKQKEKILSQPLVENPSVSESFRQIVLPITTMFDSDRKGVEPEDIEEAANLLETLLEEVNDFQNDVQNAADDMRSLADEISEMETPPEPDELLNRGDSCIENLRGY